MLSRTPLAWKNLTSNWKTLFIASGGVGFAVLLMFSQIGFRNGLFDSTVQLIRILDGDIFIVSKARYTLASEQRFDKDYLYRAKTVPGVKRIQSIYVGRVGTVLRVIGKPSRSIRVLGVPLEGRVFTSNYMDRQRTLIRDPDSALLDDRTKKMYGLERRNVKKLREQAVELSGKRINLVGFVQIGTDFVNDGTLVMSQESFAEYFALRSGLSANTLDQVDIGVVQLDVGANSKQIQKEIQAIAPQHWDVLTRDEIIQRDIRFWGQSTPIGIIFTVGTIMGLVVGTIICYQILFTEITDHIGEFATLKAMGYTGKYFFSLIMCQSVYLTVIGFFPATILTILMFHYLSESTGLVMFLTPSRIFTVFVLTLLMCIVGGSLAVRKLLSSDPASLFK